MLQCVWRVVIVGSAPANVTTLARDVQISAERTGGDEPLEDLEAVREGLLSGRGCERESARQDGGGTMPAA